MRRVEAPVEPMLKEVPMLTADEEEIKLNSVLYRPHWKSGYGFRAEGTHSIEALRVFYVNNSARMFRTRCMKGCEQIFKVADGCSMDKLFASLPNAKTYLVGKVQEDITACNLRADRINNTIDYLLEKGSEIDKIKTSSVKIPKAVDV